MRYIAVLFLALILSGCASSGRKIDQSSVDQIEQGVTTFEQMTNTFGPPLSHSYNGDGKLVASWMYFYVGPFGIGQEQQILSVQFDDNKVVEKYTMTQGNPGFGRFGR